MLEPRLIVRQSFLIRAGSEREKGRVRVHLPVRDFARRRGGEGGLKEGPVSYTNFPARVDPRRSLAV